MAGFGLCSWLSLPTAVFGYSSSGDVHGEHADTAALCAAPHDFTGWHPIGWLAC